jgi:serine/threonine-protein kinase
MNNGAVYQARPKDNTGIEISEQRGAYSGSKDAALPGASQSSPTPELRKITALEKKYYLKKNKKRKRPDEKYIFQERLIAGGMGAILKVLDQDLHRTTAMKVILPGLRTNENVVKNFITEAQITGILEHPNIIPVHDMGLKPETGMFFTMKLAQGESLFEILEKIREGDSAYRERYTLFHLLDIFRKVCNAVSFAHSKKIIHQDIKPHNIMVGDYGEVLLMDWGIARFIGNPDEEPDDHKREILKEIQSLTKRADGKVIGTPAYMSPEQISGKSDLLDQLTDIFQLGATLYHIVTLDPPYIGKNAYETLIKARNADYVSPILRHLERQVPEEVCRIILKAMAVSKENRYQRVEDLSADIEAVISGKWLQQRIRVFSPGEFLMQEGEEGDEVYMIVNGTVQVFRQINHRRTILGYLKSGDVVGEMALITNERRSATVMALEKTEVAIMNRDTFAQNLKKLPPYMEKILLTISSRLSMANKRIHPHSLTDCTYIVLKQLRLISRDPARGERNVFPQAEIISEISENLGLPAEKVEDALRIAEKADLLRRHNGFFQILNMEELIDFTELTRIWD